jgi:hypothetical protein
MLRKALPCTVCASKRFSQTCFHVPGASAKPGICEPHSFAPVATWHHRSGGVCLCSRPTRIMRVKDESTCRMVVDAELSLEHDTVVDPGQNVCEVHCVSGIVLCTELAAVCCCPEINMPPGLNLGRRICSWKQFAIMQVHDNWMRYAVPKTTEQCQALSWSGKLVRHN